MYYIIYYTITYLYACQEDLFNIIRTLSMTLEAPLYHKFTYMKFLYIGLEKKMNIKYTSYKSDLIILIKKVKEM